MGNCGTREESAVVSNAQGQQLHTSSSLAVKNANNNATNKRHIHNRSISELSDPSTPRNLEDFRKNSVLYTHVIAFTLYELETITKSFRSDYILGEGGFGTVYKGYIDENVRVGLKSLPVAVKVLNKEGLQGHREWLTEVNFLGQLRHPNLVKLIGYCCEDDHRLLVYEFMFRGSLENHLFRKTTVPLPWARRMMIALGAAKGLAFLHNAERPVIYRDFKTSNILLDSDYTAKLSDFGLAKAGPQGDETHVSTRVMGTYGYAAPEYVMTGLLTAKSDVYSFGVVLLELLTGRKSVDKTKPSKQQNLVDWTRPKLNDKRKLLQIIDPRLESQYSIRAAQKACSLAYYCLSQNPKARPLMSDVVETLEPLQSGNNAIEYSSTGTSPFVRGGTPDYRMRQRFIDNVGSGASCQSPNPNCSPSGPAAWHLTARSDVYSFGVVLLELLTGRKSVDKTKPSKEQNLVDWARPKLNDKRKLLQIIDPRLESQYSIRAAQKACSLAYYCLSQNPKARPLMSDVVETLEPLQSGNNAIEYSSTGTSPLVRGGTPDYRMRQRFIDNVGSGASCQSPNPNCSPSGPAACRVR